MLKNRFLLSTFFLLTVGFTNKNFAQCPNCNINSAFTSPGIYPNPLPDGTQGQPYDQDVTFVMFTDTMGYTVNYFKILSVNNLPFGLNWECNNSSSGCQYFPQTSIYGCVKVCGTPIQTGTFTISVNVLANFPFPAGDQYSVIDIVLTVLPASGGNSGFTFSPLGGCDSATVNFTALITNPTNPVTYNWNFGNGNSGALLNETQFYNSTGDYQVTLQTNILGYVLTDVSVNSVNGNWCGDVEEPSIPFVGCSGDPDLVFEITDANSNLLFTSSEISNVQSGSWSGLNIALNNPPFTITIWDIDVVSVNDNLGTFSFNGNAIGNFPFNGAGGTSGSLSIATTILSTFNDTATIHISESPIMPVISFSPNDSMCFGDSVTLSIANLNGDAVQWYQNNAQMINATNNQLTVSETGTYSVTVINTDGCDASSDSLTVTEMAALPNINFLISGDTLHCFLTQYNLQWFFNGVPVTGAINPIYIITQTGNYHLIVSDQLGCNRSSDTFHLNYSFNELINNDVRVNLYPVPTQNNLQVELYGWQADNALITIRDISGKNLIAYKIELGNNSSKRKFSIDTKNLSNGIYLLKMQSENDLVVRKIIVER